MAQQHTRNASSVDSTGMNARPISPHNVSSPTNGGPEHVFLMVPGGDRSRGNSVGSDDVSPTQTSFGSETMMGTPAAPAAGAGALPGLQTQTAPHDFDVSRITNDPEALTPDPGTEAEFQVQDNKFAYTPGLLGKMLNPKSLSAYWMLGGLRGLEMGLRTDRHAGLSVDETVLDGTISLEEIQQQTILASQSQSSGSSSDKEKEKNPLPAYAETNGAVSKTQVPHSQSPNIFADRRRIFAENRLPEKKVKNILQLAWIAYNDKILILLTIAAVISFAVGLYQTFGQFHPPGEPAVEWVEGLAIMVAILIVVVVGAVNDWQKERQFVKLNKRKEDRTVKVIRSGRLQEISVYDLLVGDVMNLEPGDMVPVDGVLIDGHGIKCDESSATGESDLIKKTTGDDVWRAIEGHRDTRKLDPFILSGSKVTEGVGTFLVTGVGVHSVHGKTMISLREDVEATPLQSKLNRLAEQIAKLGGASALLLFIVLFIKFLVQLPRDRSNASEKGQKFLRIVVTTITIIVVAVPEGLPLAVTLALAFATTRMLKDNNLVRLLRACETMGNATTVCSDKTGTLTQNKMTVVAGSLGTSARFGDRALLSPETADASGKEATSSLGEDGVVAAGTLVKTIAEDVRTTLYQSIVLNSTAFEGMEDGKPAFIGSKTETALLIFARDHLGLESLSVERANAQIVQLIPFDSARKCMGTVIRLSDGRVRMYVKGASEILLAKCSSIIAQPTVSGTEAPMTAETVETLTSLINTYASRSLRTIGIVYRDFAQWPPQGAATMEDDPKRAVFDDVFRDMVFLGVVGIQDPLRPGVRDSVLQCQKAGVFVRMVTGDNVVTARAIAEECGIFTPGGLVMEGPKFRRLTKMQMDRTIPRLQVLARSSPEDKRTLVKRLKELGETVAVTGDGTNDAPALKTADVGFSMGIAGTEVAKEASAIILMDDNFSSIVKAIMWGRAVNDAVKKFLQVGAVLGHA